jgi:hypothetical protein
VDAHPSGDASLVKNFVLLVKQAVRQLPGDMLHVPEPVIPVAGDRTRLARVRSAFDRPWWLETTVQSSTDSATATLALLAREAAVERRAARG